MTTNIHAEKKVTSSLADLAEMKTAELRRDFPAVSDYAIPKTKYEDKTSNGLTRCILDYIQVTGNFAERIANMGRQIGSGKNRK